MIILRKVGFTEPNFVVALNVRGFFGMGCLQVFLSFKVRWFCYTGNE
jgi:hypothetical protein